MLQGMTVEDWDYIEAAIPNDKEMMLKFTAGTIRNAQRMYMGLKDEGLNRPFEDIELEEIVNLVTKGTLH